MLTRLSQISCVCFPTQGCWGRGDPLRAGAWQHGAQISGWKLHPHAHTNTALMVSLQGWPSRGLNFDVFDNNTIYKDLRCLWMSYIICCSNYQMAIGAWSNKCCGIFQWPPCSWRQCRESRVGQCWSYSCGWCGTDLEKHQAPTWHYFTHIVACKPCVCNGVVLVYDDL